MFIPKVHCIDSSIHLRQHSSEAAFVYIYIYISSYAVLSGVQFVLFNEIFDDVSPSFYKKNAINHKLHSLLYRKIY